MESVLDRRLIVITGKGGVGKTTLTAAAALLAARRGRRAIVVELSGAGSDAGAAGRLATLLGHEPPPHGEEVALGERLWGLSIDRDRVLAEWLRALGGRVPARVLTSSASFQYLIAASPGAREMISMVKLWELAQDRRPRARGRGGVDKSDIPVPPFNDAAAPTPDEAIPVSDAPDIDDGVSMNGTGRDYDVVILDAPATGHALALLRAPQMFSAVARVGPIARQARQVRELLEDRQLSAIIGVAQATEMASSETLELRERLHEELGRDLDVVFVNGTLPRRFEGAELPQIEALDRRPTAKSTTTQGVARSAARAALTVHRRARSQQNQIARLRRHGMTVHTIPFYFQAQLDLTALQRIAARLDRAL